MEDYPSQVKEKLLSLIDEVSEMRSLFVRNPDKDFTRQRKLPFNTMLKFLIEMGGNSVYKELLESQGYDANTATTSAFIQQRDKILPAAFEFLFHEFTGTHTNIKKYKGYRLLAADGSDIQFDTTVHRILTRKQTNEVKANPDSYKTLTNKTTFDFLDLHTNKFYPITFRIVRFKISDASYVTVMINLTDFHPDEIKALYQLRWGIETSFRELKYTVGLINFHTKKAELIVQEIYARIIIYNFVEMIASYVVILYNDTNYIYQVNLRLPSMLADIYFAYAMGCLPQMLSF